MNRSDMTEGKMSEVYERMGTKKVLACVKTDCRAMLKAQTCPQETWLLQQRKNRGSIWVWKQRKSEALRTEPLGSINSWITTKSYLGYRCCFYHLILLKVWIWDERERAKRSMIACPESVDSLDLDLGPTGLRYWNTGSWPQVVHFSRAQK